MTATQDQRSSDVEVTGPLVIEVGDAARRGGPKWRSAGPRSLTLSLALSLSVSGCADTQLLPRTDDERLVQSVLGMLSGNGAPLCVDAKTIGRPLTVFRSVTLNPPPGSRLPDWYVPGILTPPPPVPSGVLLRTAQGDGAVHLDQPTNATAPLAMRLQANLDRAAMALSLDPAEQAVTIMPNWKSGMKARWWLRNRVSQHCSPNYQISNPVVGRNIGFVSVKGEHWGTTYAFSKNGSNWCGGRAVE